MDDVIYRQAAIDAIKEFQHGAAEWKEEQEELSDIWHRADSAIASAIEIGLRVKKIPSAQQWTPCKKKLPEVGQIVLICTASKSVKEATYKGLNSQEETVWLSHGNVLWDDDVVRWMPMPEPYKGDEDG